MLYAEHYLPRLQPHNACSNNSLSMRRLWHAQVPAQILLPPALPPALPPLSQSAGVLLLRLRPTLLLFTSCRLRRLRPRAS